MVKKAICTACAPNPHTAGANAPFVGPTCERKTPALSLERDVPPNLLKYTPTPKGLPPPNNVGASFAWNPFNNSEGRSLGTILSC